MVGGLLDRAVAAGKRLFHGCKNETARVAEPRTTL